jgi:hypothetical protein
MSGKAFIAGPVTANEGFDSMDVMATGLTRNCVRWLGAYAASSKEAFGVWRIPIDEALALAASMGRGARTIYIGMGSHEVVK